MGIKIYFSVCLILLSLALVAQIQPPGYQAEFGTILQTGTQKPFWLMSNEGGKYHPDNSSLFGGIWSTNPSGAGQVCTN